MPAPVASVTTQPGSSVLHSHLKKTRVDRRRGRDKLGIESDDEIHRELSTDDDTDDDQSSVESDSETESFSDDAHLNGRSEVVTPSTTQSPPPPELDGRNGLTDGIPSKASPGPFVTVTDWADMVTAEHVNGAEDLPVIDFADLKSHRIDQHVVPPTRSREAKTVPPHRSNSAPPISPPRQDNGLDVETVTFISEHAMKEPHQGRFRTQSARQAYQQRLETDPSFVPKVGEFWGHDDRLLDKDLRSLSGWWRGRWQSRGRGRGAFGMRGRGRGYFGGVTPYDINEDEGESGLPGPEVEVPPVEKPWTHDGFEEMKRRDDRRLGQQQQIQQVRLGPPRGFGFRARGGFYAPRGRGGSVRGGSASPTGSRQGQPGFTPVGRPWFAMKPERMWTKQHDAFLYFDSALKPRPGVGPGFRVKFPGGPEQVIRAPPRSYPILRVGFTTPTSSAGDDGEKLFVVRIPRRAGKEKATEETSSGPSAIVEESATTMAELTIEEVFTVRPNIVPNRRLDLDIPSKPLAIDDTSHAGSPTASAAASLHSEPESSQATTLSSFTSLDMDVEHRTEQLSLEPPIPRANSSSPSAQITETVLHHPSLSEDVVSSLPLILLEEPPRPAPPVLHPLQTTFSPVPQTSPSYGSPYAYGPPLPPGIGMSQHGMPYELATGRPVYIHQQTPPPMFTPRPLMHAHVPHPSTSVPFVPAHMHHHSATSPDFLSQSHTPPMSSFIDPSTGVPIFTPARQSSRIEIRAPTDATDGKKSFTRPSGLRTTLSSSETYLSADVHQQPTEALEGDNAPAPDEARPIDQPPAQVMEQAMAYPPYQQPYYYPEPYAYGPYIDMSPQVMHYEMYPADHRNSQPPMIYY